MAITTTTIEREFIIEVENNKITLDDPNPNLSPNEVRDLYANQYPELTNATLENKGIINDKLVFEFNSVLGTKG
jgi:PRTRC genetic system protein C